MISNEDLVCAVRYLLRDLRERIERAEVWLDMRIEKQERETKIPTERPHDWVSIALYGS